MMLRIFLVVGILGTAAQGLTLRQAKQFNNSYECTPSGSDTAPETYARYNRRTSTTTITTNHLPNHVWECVNPNSPAEISQTYSLSTVSDSSLLDDDEVYCLPMGSIGVAKNGVQIYNPLTSDATDAYEQEVMDCNGGHSDANGNYHYHSLPENYYVYDPSDSSSQFIGVAFDGIPIYSQSSDISDSDLDICRGMTVNGQYRYIASVSTFPYFLGCYRAKPQVSSINTSQKCSGMSQGSVCSCAHGILDSSNTRVLKDMADVSEMRSKKSTCGTTYCGEVSTSPCGRKRSSKLARMLEELLQEYGK